MNNRVKVNELENSYDQWKSGTVTVKISQHDSTQSETHQLVNWTGLTTPGSIHTHCRNPQQASLGWQP